MKVTNSIKRKVASLDAAKYRRQENAFKAEGTKCVLDTLHAFNIQMLVATEEWLSEHSKDIPADASVFIASETEMQRMTHMTTAPDVISVYELPHYSLNIDTIRNSLTLALDTVQDPGNLGTIIRLADWFGVSDILCSFNTADAYNPKTIKATMGAISRVRVHYCDLADTLSSLATHIPVYGTFLDGQDIFNTPLSKNGIIILGNEGNGISTEVGAKVTNRITIPSFPPHRKTSESLNVAMAAAITLAQFRSQK